MSYIDGFFLWGFYGTFNGFHGFHGTFEAFKSINGFHQMCEKCGIHTYQTYKIVCYPYSLPIFITHIHLYALIAKNNKNGHRALEQHGPRI